MSKTLSAGGVVTNQQGQILLVSQYGQSWSFPKGHIEPGEDPLETATREIYEESGVSDLEYVKPLGQYSRYRLGQNGIEDDSELKTIFLFHFKTLHQGQLQPIDPDNPEARWVNKTEVSKLLTHPADGQFFQTILNQL